MRYTGTNSTKGSSSRVTDQEAFSNNFDAIFRKDKPAAITKVVDTQAGMVDCCGASEEHRCKYCPYWDDREGYCEKEEYAGECTCH